jgi:hypothetical protein
LIVTGQLVSLTEPNGTRKVQINGSSFDVHVASGTIQVDQTLKGRLPAQSISEQTYRLDDPTELASIPLHSYAVFLLRTDIDGSVQFTSLHYPVLPAAPGYPAAEGTPIEKVVSSVGSVVFSQQSSAAQKTHAVFILSRSKSAAATEVLHQAMEDSARNVQLGAAGALLGQVSDIVPRRRQESQTRG